MNNILTIDPIRTWALLQRKFLPFHKVVGDILFAQKCTGLDQHFGNYLKRVNMNPHVPFTFPESMSILRINEIFSTKL